jgi:putative transposase
MNAIYQLADVSKQAFYQHLAGQARSEQMEAEILAKVDALRTHHPAMGARKMYHLLSPLPIGRDRFEQLVLTHGYRVRIVKNFTKTTHRSKRYLCFSNLCAGLVIQRTNRVWSSDITYFRVDDRFYYLIFEIDLYSRRILGDSVSLSLDARANLAALHAALDTRGFATYQYQLIHHSDPGTQYLCDEMIALSTRRKYRISIGSSVWENPHIERVNGIIKNEYLRFMTIRTPAEMKRAMATAVNCYNNERPHWSLGLMAPIPFERYIAKIPVHERPALRPWTEMMNEIPK